MWGPRPSNCSIAFTRNKGKLLATQEVKSKDKGPMFALLWKTRTVLRSISNNLKEHHRQTSDKAENNNGFRDLFFLCAI